LIENAALDELVQRAREHDSAALGDSYREFRPRVTRLCRYLLGNREEAEDAAGEIFARLPRAMKSYDTPLPFPRWLLSIADHYCIDLLRKRRVEQRVFVSSDPDVPEPRARAASPLEELLCGEARARVQRAIKSLSERYRVPLALRHYNDLSYDEIATALGLARANVAVLIFRAKQEIRATLADAADSVDRKPRRRERESTKGTE
jgi:RNA polymerase sigma-70 factor, ECF subfamily